MVGDRNWHREASAIDAIRATIASTKAEPIWWHEQFCPAGACLEDVDGMPLYMDDNHLSRRGAHHAETALRRLFNDVPARN